MTSIATTHRWRKTLARSAVIRSAGLSMLGVIGWLWFLPANVPLWPAVTLVVVLTLNALAGTAWYLARARVEGRWWAAWDRYAELAMEQATHPQRYSHTRSRKRRTES